MTQIPEPQIEESDDHLYVSPTSDDSPSHRYQKVRENEARISDEAFLEAIRNPSPLFPDNY